MRRVFARDDLVKVEHGDSVRPIVSEPRPVLLHARLLGLADMVDVDIDRQAVERTVKDIERRAALESNAWGNQAVE